MRRVTEEISVEQDVTDVASDVGTQPGALEQLPSKRAQTLSRVADGLVAGHGAKLTKHRGSTILNHIFDRDFPALHP